MSEKVTRRGYVKYAAAGVVVVAGAAAGAYYATKPGPTPTTSEIETTEAKTSLKMAMILEVPENDMGWGEINKMACEHTVKWFKENRDVDIDLSMSFLIPPPEFDKQGRVYADQGYDLIFYPCDGHGPEVTRVANEFKDNPDIHWHVAATVLDGDIFPKGTPVEELVIPSNLAVTDYIAFTNTYYLMGMIAGAVTKTNKVGFIGGEEYPSIHRRMRAMQKGVLRSNPSCDVSQYVWVGSWVDVGKGKELAEAMHEYGCDVIMSYADGPAVGAATYCTEAGPPPYFMGAMFPLQTKFPTSILCDGVEYTAAVMCKCVDSILNNTWSDVGGKWSKLGYSKVDPAVAYVVGDYETSDVMPMGPLINAQLKSVIPSDALALIDQVKGDIAAGTFKVPEISE